jgi:catechol 2,3-dioxygenase-like lactoylglutathione lyase family enzyme
MPGRFTGSSAVPLLGDLARSIDYYRDRLGFSCEAYGDPPDFCVAERDEVTILMALCEEAERIVPNWRIVDKVWNVYIRVDDVEANNAPSGFREFGVQDPDGHDVGIGQQIDRTSP